MAQSTSIPLELRVIIYEYCLLSKTDIIALPNERQRAHYRSAEPKSVSDQQNEKSTTKIADTRSMQDTDLASRY